jgi:hypothetical protein
LENVKITDGDFSEIELDDLSGSEIIDISINPEGIKEVFVDTGQAIYLSSIFGLKIRD